MNLKKAKLGKFISYYKPYKLLFAADIFCAMLAAAMSLVFPQLIQMLTGDVLSTGQGDMRGQILAVAGAMLLTIAVKTFSEYFYDAKGHTMGAMMERDMRQELFDHLQVLSFSFYDENKPGKLMSRLTNDLNWLAELYHHGPEDLIVYLVQFFGSLIILFGIHPRLTLIIVAFFPFIILYAVIFNKKLKRAYDENYEAISEVNAQAEENLSGIRVVQSFCNEEIEKKRFGRQNHRFFRSRRSIYHNESYYYTGMDTFGQLITAAVVVCGAVFILGESLSLPQLITFIMYVNYLVGPIQKISQITQLYQSGFAGFERFYELLNTLPEVTERENLPEVTLRNSSVEFQNVSFHYGDCCEEILADVNFKIHDGDYIALVGISGTGKSTLCSLIPRFYDATGGKVLVGGQDVKELSLSVLRQAVGVVQQDTYLFSGSVMDNILYGRPGAARNEVVEAAKRAGAHEFIEKLPNGYDTDIGHRGVKLSGGQKQRISIARTFLKDPRILILDEATSSLDNESEHFIQQSLETLKTGRTTLVIAHRLTTIRGAKEILLLADGTIRERGSHTELMALQKEYYKLYVRSEEL